MSFPSVAQHYIDLLYGAYKSADPNAYLREFLEPYADTLSVHQVRYLHKLVYDRERMKKDEVMRYVQQEEQGANNTGYLLARFLFFATSLCHVWYREAGVACVYALDPERSTIIFYKEPNVPVPYVWLDVCAHTGQVDLVRSNVGHLQALSLTVLWKWVDGNEGASGAGAGAVTQHCTYDLCTGQRYVNVGARGVAGAGAVLRVVVSGVEGRVGLSCELGVQHEWPFVMLLTYSVLDTAYTLSKLLYNSPSGHLLPLLCALHPLPQQQQQQQEPSEDAAGGGT